MSDRKETSKEMSTLLDKKAQNGEVEKVEDQIITKTNEDHNTSDISPESDVLISAKC